MQQTIIISLGGSIVVPNQVDTKFLKQFKELILDIIKKNKVVIMVGGGKLARNYQDAAKKFKVDQTNLDWVGTIATRLNAELVRAIFAEYAEEKVCYIPNEKPVFNKKILVAAGYKPGWSTDYDAVLLAAQLQADMVVNMSNIDYVYDKDPKKHRNAKPIKIMSWDDMKKLVGDKWTPGKNAPFDPVACKKAAEIGLKVVILNGTKLKNLKEFLHGGEFKGTIIK